MARHPAPKTSLLETNVTLHDATCIPQFQANGIVIPLTVLEEIEFILCVPAVDHGQLERQDSCYDRNSGHFGEAGGLGSMAFSTLERRSSTRLTSSSGTSSFA